MITDVLTPRQRRLNMSRIRGRDTKPELLVRKGLHVLGLRFRLHRRGLPGSPDIVLVRHRTVVFVHGCFWHGHSCSFFKMPTTRTEFWKKKIFENISRDDAAMKALIADGWRVVTVWECALRGTGRLPSEHVCRSVEKFILRGRNRNMTIAGSRPRRGARA